MHQVNRACPFMGSFLVTVFVRDASIFAARTGIDRLKMLESNCSSEESRWTGGEMSIVDDEVMVRICLEARSEAMLKYELVLRRRLFIQDSQKSSNRKNRSEDDDVTLCHIFL